MMIIKSSFLITSLSYFLCVCLIFNFLYVVSVFYTRANNVAEG